MSLEPLKRVSKIERLEMHSLYFAVGYSDYPKRWTSGSVVMLYEGNNLKKTSF